MDSLNCKDKLKSSIGTFLIISTFLIMWEALVRTNTIDIFFFSKPSSIVFDLYKMTASGELFLHTSITLKETFSGLFIGTLTGLLTAFVFWQFKLIAAMLDPIIMAMYSIPKLALGPLFILWFGIGIKSKIFLATLMVFFLVFFNTYAGVRNVDPALISVVKLMGASKYQTIKKIILPSCTPWILAGIRAGLGAGLLGAIVGEYLGSKSGLGYMVEYAGGMFDLTRVISCIVVLTTLMSVMNACLKLVEKRVLKWRPISIE